MIVARLTAVIPACAPWLLMIAVTTARPAAQSVRFEHRVAIATSSLDAERDVEASLERNVNALAAVGYELTAFVGGQGAVVDRLLERKPYAAGLVDHGGHTLAIMARPVGRVARSRQYRLLHTRRHVGVDPIVADLGASGYHLAATAVEGDYFHAAFERTDGPRHDYRVFANRGRTSWMAQVQRDADVMSRLRRVAPMGIDHALVELEPAPAAPGALEWFSVKAQAFASSDARLQARAALGYRVQMVRMRNTTDVDVLLVKPAGAVAAHSYELEDAPWGMPCTRGPIVGADVFTDGDTYCVADRAGTAVSNRGFDLRVRPHPATPGALLDVPGCETLSALGSPRVAVRRLVVAAQLERALNAGTPPGFRVTRALAGTGRPGDSRLTLFATRDEGLPLPPPSSSDAPEPAFMADRDEWLASGRVRQEDLLSSALTMRLGHVNGTVWVEVSPTTPATVRLAGCVRTTLERSRAEGALGALIVRTALDRATVRNDILVNPWQ